MERGRKVINGDGFWLGASGAVSFSDLMLIPYTHWGDFF